MAADFDPEDKYSWYFGPLNREETNEILIPEKEPGVFLVRESQSIRGDFVLCVKEENKISHYIINKITNPAGITRFRIGDQEFSDIPSLLNFYKTHYLDTTSLIKPAKRAKYVAKFDFTGKDPEDLPFKKGDVLELISKDEKEWWTCRNSHGDVGQIPVPYVTKDHTSVLFQQFDPNNPPIPSQRPISEPPGYIDPQKPSIKDITLPARAQVIQQRIPNLYDKTQLKLEKGDIVLVTKMNSNGQWEGEINGRKGVFPFTHVRFTDNENSTS
ncbi:adapter molecule Crk-like isoform X1 [Mytilus edulis]|uniref:adapter molecule Crk-like isoform X1 n=1 Tax=Mytilus edulis TaxID=6550 RepID=UPI0039EF6FA8